MNVLQTGQHARRVYVCVKHGLQANTSAVPAIPSDSSPGRINGVPPLIPVQCGDANLLRSLFVGLSI